MLTAGASQPLLTTWHHRFGHLHPAAIQDLTRSESTARWLKQSPHAGQLLTPGPTFTHVRNPAPHHALRSRTPHELWHGAPAPVSHLRALGCGA